MGRRPPFLLLVPVIIDSSTRALPAVAVMAVVVEVGMVELLAFIAVGAVGVVITDELLGALLVEMMSGQ